jgi:hypothetical protein
MIINKNNLKIKEMQVYFYVFFVKIERFFKIWSIGILCEVPFQYFILWIFWIFREFIWNIACVNLLWSLKII